MRETKLLRLGLSSEEQTRCHEQQTEHLEPPIVGSEERDYGPSIVRLQ